MVTNYNALNSGFILNIIDLKLQIIYVWFLYRLLFYLMRAKSLLLAKKTGMSF